MEGQREEYLANRVPKLIAHIAEVEENQTDIEESICNAEENILNNEFAAMSLGVPNNIQFSTYALLSFYEMLTDLLLTLSSISQGYNSALDSACTNHIFHDCNVFHTYNVDGAVPMKTANCSILQTLGIGDVKIKLVIGDRVITWTLTKCLHALDVPINLISVGTLQEHQMLVNFSFQKTSIIFPSDCPHLLNVSFDAHVTCRLYLLNLEFIPPIELPIALQSFPAVHPSLELWHCRFGHLGHEASKNVLNENYATGLTQPLTPYPVMSRCILCLIGKSPQAPYAHNAKHATNVGDLVLSLH